MTPARLLRLSAIVYVLAHALGLFFLAAFDAQGNHPYFRLATLILIWASVSFVIGTALVIRRSWLGEPPREILDEVLPAVIVFIVGWIIWAATHALI